MGRTSSPFSLPRGRRSACDFPGLDNLQGPVPLAPWPPREAGTWIQSGNGHRIRLSGAGQPGRRHGQGARRCLRRAREVFDEVDEALGQKLSQIMWEGPKETLTLTENAQPALMAVSMAVMRVLESEKGFSLPDKVKFVAGHSLGEYSALAAAGAFSLADAARLLKLRGQAMQKAVPVGLGAMAALLGVGIEVAEKVAAEAAQGDVCQVANDNEPTQVVLSGAQDARSTASPRSARNMVFAAPCRCRSPRPSIAR